MSIEEVRQKSKDMRREAMELREKIYEIKRLEWDEKTEIEKETCRQMIISQEIEYLNEWLNNN